MHILPAFQKIQEMTQTSPSELSAKNGPLDCYPLSEIQEISPELFDLSNPSPMKGQESKGGEKSPFPLMEKFDLGPGVGQVEVGC